MCKISNEDINNIVNSISNIQGTFSWDKALKPEGEVPNQDYLIASKAIVEPDGVSDNYFNLQDEYPEDWVNFIKRTCGKEWGQLAEVVLDFGY